MKKLLLVGLAICFAFTVNAQDKDKKSLPNGFRLGYQSSTLTGGNSGTFDPLTGFYVGYLRKVNLIPLLHLETGMEYMMAGGKQDSITLRQNYIVLPAQLVFKIGPVFALAGVNANFDIYQSTEMNGTKEKVASDNRADAFDVAADVGAGLNFLFLAVEARYYWGLTDLKDGYKSQYLQLGLKVHF